MIRAHAVAQETLKGLCVTWPADCLRTAARHGFVDCVDMQAVHAPTVCRGWQWGRPTWYKTHSCREERNGRTCKAKN
eukprot:4449999-Pyramimonas_sp.AAC.1